MSCERRAGRGDAGTARTGPIRRAEPNRARTRRLPHPPAGLPRRSGKYHREDSGSENANRPRRGRRTAASDRWLGSSDQPQRLEAVPRLVEAATAEGGDHLSTGRLNSSSRSFKLSPSETRFLKMEIGCVLILQDRMEFISTQAVGVGKHAKREDIEEAMDRGLQRDIVMAKRMVQTCGEL